jgi:hypothetical protein
VQSKPINEANVQSKPINEVRSKELLDLGKHCQNVGKTNATLNGFVNKYLNKDFILAISVPNENILDLKSQHRLKTAMAIEKMGEEAQKSPNLSPDEKLFLKEVAAIAKDIKEQSITQNELAAKQAELVGKLEENPQSANPQLQTEIGNLQKKSNELEAKIVSRNRQPLPLPANHHSLIELNRNDNQLLDTLLKKDKKPNMGVFQKEYLDQKYIDQMQPDPYYSLNKQSRAIQQKAMAIEKMGEEAQKNPNLSPDEKLAMKKAADMARNIRSQSEEAHHFEREKAYFLPRLSNPNIPPEQKNRLLAEYKKREARHEEYIFKRNEMMLNSKLPPIQKHVSKVDSQKSVRQEAQQIGNDLNKQLLSSSKQVIRQVIKNYFRKNNRSQGR